MRSSVRSTEAAATAGRCFTNDFIEIFNPGPDPVNLAGLVGPIRIERRIDWSVTALVGRRRAGALSPRSGGAAASGGTTPLPAPDSTGTIGMAAGDGKVALVRSVTPLAGACPAGGDLVDLVGYGAANCSEGGAPAPALAANISAVRAQAGCVDTNVNGSDFGTASPPTPRNSARR